MAWLWAGSAVEVVSIRVHRSCRSSAGELGAEDRIGDADPVCCAGEGQDVELVAAAFVEGGVPGDDADSGMRPLGQSKQVADLTDHVRGAVQPPLEGALVGDHLKQPGHTGGLVRLAVRQQVPLLVNVASTEDTRRDRTEVALPLHEGRDQPEAVHLGERGLGLDQHHVPVCRAHPGGAGVSQGGGEAARRAMSIIESAAWASDTPYSTRIRATSAVGWPPRIWSPRGPASQPRGPAVPQPPS